MSSHLSIRRVGTPRLDKMERLLHRVCEVLFLLKALNITMASHQITIREDAHSLQSIRRDFLRNLAFVCDFLKGGSTTTAIGLSETTKGRTVWIASNQGANMRTVDFVNTIISQLRNMHTSQDNTQATEESIIHTCISFANQRIRKESALLCRIVVRCNEIAEQRANQSEAPICNWLRRFDKSLSPDMICRLAYDSRHMPEMKALETHLRSNKVVPRPTNGLDYNLQQTRHLIGRLAHHVRAARNLVADAACLEDLFDALTVKTVDGIEAIHRPAPDSHTTIESMLRRMIRSNDNRMNHFQQKLADVDSKIGILPKIVELYEHPQGDIHAEIQILEYFYRHNLSYAAGDRFIACSKPACLCCRLYIRYHPARCSEPDSHQKIYTKWAVPDTQANTLQTMTSVLHDLQQLALDGIDKKWPSTVYRPDSVTGITMSNLTDIDQTSDASDTTCSNDESVEDNDVLHGSEPGTPTSDGTAVLPLMSNGLQEYDIETAPGNASDSDEDEGGVLLL